MTKIRIIPTERKCRAKACGKIKSIENFRKRIRKDRGYIEYSYNCLDCDRAIARIKSNNLPKDKKKQYNDKYRATENGKKKRRLYLLNNKKDISVKQLIYKKEKRKNKPSYKLRENISRSICRNLELNSSTKNGKSCLKYLPYTIKQLKEYLESKFEKWMTWDNHGVYRAGAWDDNDESTWTWQLDHIIPQSKLPYSSMEDDNFKKCWALSNLRPLSAKQNIIDGNRR